MASFTELYQKYKDDFDKVTSLFTDSKEDRSEADYRKEYDGERNRRKKSVGFRETKTVGEGSDKKTIYPAKIVFNFPKKIVRTAVAFLCGGEMTLNSSDDNDAFDVFNAIWTTELKMQSIIKEFVRTAMIETKVAAVFFPQPVEPYYITGTKEKTKNKLRVKILKNEEGSEFFPHFDDFDDMDAFYWKYNAVDEENQPVTVVKIWTKDKIITGTKSGGAFEVIEKKNLFGIIPVVYTDRDRPEWEDIVTEMDQFENRISRLSDTNDYFSEPMLMLFGKPKSMPGKDQVGKVVEFDKIETIDGKQVSGDARYLTWEQFPDSIKLELDTLWNGVFSGSSTPDLSFDNLKGIGANLAGYTIKMMMIDAIIKADDNRDEFGKAFKRMISVVKAGVGKIMLSKHSDVLQQTNITVNFGLPIPDDLKEAVEILVKATGDKQILSTQSAVKRSPLTSDPDEYDKIQEEAQQEAENMQTAQIGSFFTGNENTGQQ